MDLLVYFSGKTKVKTLKLLNTSNFLKFLVEKKNIKRQTAIPISKNRRFKRQNKQ